MIHYMAELALWTALIFLAGCPFGALARRLWESRGRRAGDDT